MNDINDKDESDLNSVVQVISFCFPFVGGLFGLFT